MKIERIEAHLIRVPFDMGAAPKAFAGMSWTSVDSLFVRVTTEDGVHGWGEGWGHVACPTTIAALTSLVGPAFIGQDLGDRAGLMRRMQHRFHIHGRTGPVNYALSALEIALWDIAGKVAGQPIASLLGGAPCTLDAYASLLRYSEPPLVASAVERALAQGFRHLKLHEEQHDAIGSARDAAGDDTWIALDTNCPWSVSEAIAHARALEPLRLAWLEEPVWPPEDHAGLARVRDVGVPIAAGENAHGLHDFMHLFQAGALDICQPSVTKIGGVTEQRKILALAEAHAVQAIPHCAYFGPGMLASLHVVASMARETPIERLYMDLEACPFGGLTTAKDGTMTVPTGPGLGCDPDPKVIEKYRVR